MVFKSNTSTIIGLILLIVYLIQYVLKIEWPWLLELQEEQLYKRWSGLVLAIFIVFQWVLTFARVVKRGRKYNMKMQRFHKWLGAVSPLFFYFHSMALGYGYLLLLSYIFLFNALLGYINLDVIKSKNDLIFKGWMMAHVALSIMITIIMVFHIGTVFYYK